MDQTKEKTVKEMVEGLKELFAEADAGDFPKPKLGGLLVKQCLICGGTVVMSGTGVIVEACSSCGRKYIEPVYRANSQL